MSTHNLKQKVEQLNLSKQTFINPPMHLLHFFFLKNTHPKPLCKFISKFKRKSTNAMSAQNECAKLKGYPASMTNANIKVQHSPQTHHISLLKHSPKSCEVFCAWLWSCQQQTSTLMQTTHKIQLEADLTRTSSTVLLFWYLHSQGHWTWLKKVSSQVSATAYSLHGRLVSLFTVDNFDLFSEASHSQILEC